MESSRCWTLQVGTFLQKRRITQTFTAALVNTAAASRLRLINSEIKTTGNKIRAYLFILHCHNTKTHIYRAGGAGESKQLTIV